MKKEETYKNNKKKNEKNNQKGITLIALVITIIVLIILAGISINLVLGENGLFNKAKQAAEEYKQAAINEQKMTNDLEEGIEKISNDNRPKTIKEAKDKNYGYFYEQTTLADSDGNKVVVPAGFKIAADSGDNVTAGIVIEDKDIINGIGEDRGNQYVWIPVSNINEDGNNLIKKSTGEGKTEDVEITLGRYEFADGTESYTDNEGNPIARGKEILRQTAEKYTEETTIQLNYQELKKYRDGVKKTDATGENRTAKELEKFIESVRQNGGYYIARYEASYGANKKANSKISNNFNNTTSVESEPTTEGFLWNNITQINAAEACDGIYTTVQSDLVNSYAWDTAIVYIQKFSGRTDYSMQNSKNHTLANTGVNDDEVCKINDMASNCFEWTTECSTNTNNTIAYTCVSRGGYCGTSSEYYTSSRNPNIANYSIIFKNYTFRPILYIGSPVS